MTKKQKPEIKKDNVYSEKEMSERNWTNTRQYFSFYKIWKKGKALALREKNGKIVYLFF